jgi:hypothetical protein
VVVSSGACGQVLRKAGETAYQLHGARTRLAATERLKLPDALAMAASTRQAISLYEKSLQVTSRFLHAGFGRGLQAWQHQ